MRLETSASVVAVEISAQATRHPSRSARTAAMAIVELFAHPARTIDQEMRRLDQRPIHAPDLLGSVREVPADYMATDSKRIPRH